MHRYTRIAAGTVFAGSLFFTGGIAPASAAHVDQDGLVNVNVPVTIENNEILTNFLNNNDVDLNVAIPVSVAANAAVIACDLLDVDVNQVAVLARAAAVDRSGQDQTICRTDQGDVTLTNNIPQSTN